MPTEHNYIDVRDLFISINPNGLDEKELARDGASFVEPQTINDYHLFRAGYQAALEAQQGQGEPVALAIPDECPHIIVFDDADRANEHFCGAGARPAALRRYEQISQSWNAHLFVRIARNSRDDRYPSATVADPAEVERLRADITYWKSAHDGSIDWCNQIIGEREEQRAKAESLRAQLAEAHALLRECQPCLEKAGYGTWQIDEMLSASAEPSAPVEIDEHQAFIEACRQAALAKGREIDPQALEQRPDGSYVNPLTECGWWGWLARAALARKP